MKCRKPLFSAIQLACTLTLGSCATQYGPMTPELQARLQADLVAGKASLDCNIGCVGTWVFQRDALGLLAQREDWVGLGTKVMQIGFQEDLAYYYLGRAAEGLKAYDAAKKYYGITGYIATHPGTLRCGDIEATANMDPCNGVRLPQAVFERLRIVDAMLNPAGSKVAKRRLVKHASLTPGSSSTSSVRAGSDEDLEKDFTSPPPITR